VRCSVPLESALDASGPSSSSTDRITECSSLEVALDDLSEGSAHSPSTDGARKVDWIADCANGASERRSRERDAGRFDIWMEGRWGREMCMSVEKWCA
jgi:hypothetical protein